jgi:hypothetical protein
MGLTGIGSHEVAPSFHPLSRFWGDEDAMAKNCGKTPA